MRTQAQPEGNNKVRRRKTRAWKKSLAMVDQFKKR